MEFETIVAAIFFFFFIKATRSSNTICAFSYIDVEEK